MKTIGILSLIVFTTTAFAGLPKGPLKKGYGDTEQSFSKAIPVDQAILALDELGGKDITMSGKVVKSCSKMGCWVSMESGGKKARAIFKDHGFAVPKEIVGKNIVAVGVLSEKEVSESKAKHFAKDDGASKEDLAAIKGPQKAFQFLATRIKIL